MVKPAAETLATGPMEETFLDGKVLKRSLPVLEGVPQGEVSRLKRLLLPQGELAQIYDGPEGMQYIAMVELRSGAVRGNHFHKVKQEWLYIFQGEVHLTVAELQNDRRDGFALRAGEMAFIPSGIAHAIRTIEPGQALEFAVAPFDAADVYPFVVDGAV